MSIPSKAWVLLVALFLSQPACADGIFNPGDSSGSGAVASVTGTSGQVVASPTTGAVVLTLPSTITQNETFSAGIDGSAIGANTPSTGAFTTISQAGSANINDTITVTGGSSTAGWTFTNSTNGRGVFFGNNSFNGIFNTTGGGSTILQVGGTSELSISTALITAAIPVKLPGYTVATLPSGSIGSIAYVTDAVACTFLAALTGSGSTVCPVFYNGTAWVGG
jgi:hypothetical protein